MEQPRFCWVVITNLSWALVQSSCALQLCLIRAFVFEFLGSQVEFSSWKFPPYITDRKPLGFWDKTRYLNISWPFQVPKGSRDWQIYPGASGDFRPLATIIWIPGSMFYRCLKAFWTWCFAAGYSSVHLMTLLRKYWGPCERISWFLTNLLQPRSKGKEGQNGSTRNK